MRIIKDIVWGVCVMGFTIGAHAQNLIKEVPQVVKTTSSAASSYERVGQALEQLASDMEQVVRADASAASAYQQFTMPDIDLAHAFLLPKTPAIGETSWYVRKARWGKKLKSVVAPGVLKHLIAARIVEASFPGYITDFEKEYAQAINEGFCLRDWNAVLETYPYGTSFYVTFVSSWREVLALHSAPFVSSAIEYPLHHRFDYQDSYRQAVSTILKMANQKKSGFLVILKMRKENMTENRYSQKDVLIVDLQNKQLISLNKTLSEVKTLAEKELIQTDR